MKFHNQKSFRGHEISNVENRPLLRKKGKQWIVVAVSALILAGFGGMVSTTTHADTTATSTQPTTTKVAPTPANNPAKATTPAPSTNNNTKPSSVKPVAPKATQPSTKNIGQQASNLHVKLLSQAPVTDPDQNVVAHGYWNYNNPSTNNTPVWNLYSNGNLKVSKNPNNHSNSDTTLATKSIPSSWAPESDLYDALNISASNAQKVKTLSFSHVQAPSDGIRLCDDEGTGYFPNLQTLDLRGLSLNNVKDGTAMFGGLRGLTNVIGLKTPNNFNASLLFVSDPKLKSIDLTYMSPISSSTGGMFAFDNNLTTITLGPHNSLTGSELFNGDGVPMPSNQATWTPLSGHNVTVGYGSNNNTLSKNNTWNVGNTPLQATDTIKYINSENGKPILCKNIHPGHGGDYATLTGTYGTYVSSSVWGDWTATNMPAFDTLTQNPNPKYSDDINPSNLSSKNIKYNGTTYTVQITPNQANSTVNYVDQNRHNEGSYTFRGDSDNANGAIKQTFGYDPAGLNPDYYVIHPSDQIKFDNNSTPYTELVAKKVSQPINYQWFNQSVGSTTLKGIPYTTGTITGAGLNPGWTIYPGTYGTNSTGTFTFPNSSTNNPITMGVAPIKKTDIINYQYGGHTLGTNLVSGNDYRTGVNDSFNISKDSKPSNIPSFYHVANDNNDIEYDGEPHNISIAPDSATDTIDYQYNGQSEGSHQFSGSDAAASGASNTNFTLSSGNASGLSNNYQLVDASQSFDYDGGTYNVAVEPRSATDIINYMNGNNKLGSDQFNGQINKTFTINNINKPNISNNYQLVNPTQTFYYDGGIYNVAVEPKSATDTINYMNGSNEVGSAEFSGAYNSSFSIGSTPSNLNSNYYSVNSANQSFTYNGNNYDVAVSPKSVNDTFTFSGDNNYSYKSSGAYGTSGSVSAPSGYEFSNGANGNFSFNGSNHTFNVIPASATDQITFNGDSAANTSMTGSYNDKGSVSAPSGYHFTNSQSSETFTYNNSSASFSVAPNSATEKINYVYQNGNGTFNEGSTTMSGAYNEKGNVTSTTGLSSGYQLSNASNSFTYANGSASDDVSVKPLSASAVVDYQYNGSTVSGYTSSGNNYQATDAGNNSVTISTNNAPELPAGWHVVNYSSNIPFNNGTYSVPVAPDSATDTIDYQYNNQTLASASFIGNSFGDSSASDTKFTISSSNEPKMPANYHLASNETFNYDGNTHPVNVLPNKVSDTINYVDNMGDTSNVTVSGTYNTKVSNSDITSHVPLNNKVVNSNNSFIFDGHSHKVEVIPQKTDTIRYVNGDDNSLIRSASFSGNDVYDNVSDTTFNANTQVPNGYHVASDNEFNYDGQSHNVTVYPNTLTIKFNNGDLGNIKVSDLTGSTYKLDLNKLPKYYHLANNSSDTINLDSLGKSVDYNINVVPNIVTVNYMNGNNKISSDTATFDGKDNTISDNFGIPVGYQLVNNQTSLSYDNQTTNVAVEPIPQTNTINYMNGSSKVSSTKSTGNDYQAQSAGNTTFTISNAPTNYHLANGNQTFNYDGSTDNVSVAPNTITVTYKSGSSAVGSDTVAYQSGSKVNDDYDMPAGYQLAQSNNQLNFNKASNAVDVLVKPVNKTDTINYMYNDTKVGSTQANGVDVYANGSAFNANTKVPAGYHAVDANNGFYYDGQQHDVSVAPNVDTDTVDYQANGQTLASQQFQGNDENATQAGNNSFDVTAKNDTKMPNGYELVNNNNEFSFDNGNHNVAVQAIPQPQPSVPFMPSMPASSASSTSSSASAPASMAMPSSSATTKSQSASHYRYAKVVTPLQLHTSKHFTKKNGVLTVEHPTEFKIMKIVHDHKYARYEVKYQGRNYFITANDHFTINDYVQKHDFKSHKHMMVKVIKPMIEYKRSRFNRKYAIKVFKKGAILPVKRVFNFGEGEKTRFELTNGRFVTSNKLFVKVIK